MNTYTPNRACRCQRCMVRGLMGPAILITLGVLFLIQEFDLVRFDQSFPVLLIVIGSILYLGRAASTEGHLEPYQPPAPGPPLPPPAKPSSQEMTQ